MPQESRTTLFSGPKKQNVTMLWKIFGPVINPHKNNHKTKISKLVTYLGDTLTGSNEISNEFNQYFASVCKK